MKTLLLSVQSATFAFKAKKVFNRNNINCRIVKLDASKSKNGCTHGIEIAESDFWGAIMMLKKENIDYSVL